MKTSQVTLSQNNTFWHNNTLYNKLQKIIYYDNTSKSKQGITRFSAANRSISS